MPAAEQSVDRNDYHSILLNIESDNGTDCLIVWMSEWLPRGAWHHTSRYYGVGRRWKAGHWRQERAIIITRKQDIREQGRINHDDISNTPGCW